MISSINFLIHLIRTINNFIKESSTRRNGGQFTIGMLNLQVIIGNTLIIIQGVNYRISYSSRII
ncbi:hypothetical protein FUT84_07695 [Treponema phagedenis]|uniref:Uncharacterized protein n=1 Tax=Treponema phagedenis TaxID=162 RepID=A0AAE6M709_TREPH|nr:hypothetical protein FUT79_07855 [Treponema phagedenis]QEJ98206.1 hypothetical protein FUT82_09485 [Treponema phagedenis]QEK01046.1 hypothetical protein FUT84_07695 [Treponema phagedenis]QEK03714.1 hypothetical protein FUT83_07790 [Treponema phagedenis]QEK06055.1 hypothetical protein FUT80_04595 [Treponema phagedenis]